MYDIDRLRIMSSADSVADRGNSKTIPDFTRGVWRDTEPLGIVDVAAKEAVASG